MITIWIWIGRVSRDSSAASIAASGLLELAGLDEDPDYAERWIGAAEYVMHLG